MIQEALSVFLKWIHLMATVAWIGGMFTNFFIYLPILGRTLDPPVAGKFMGAVMQRFRVMVYISMAVFLMTGIALGSLHQNSVNAYASNDAWVMLMILKVLLFILMVVLALFAFEGMAPKVARMAASGPSPELLKAQKTQKRMAIAGFVLGMFILALSAAL